MTSLCSSSFRAVISQWRHCRMSRSYWRFPIPRRNLTYFPSPVSASFSHDENPSPPNKPILGYDPSEELFGLSADSPLRKVSSESTKPRSWFGPNGLYIRELPCPSCRGRGYTPCTDCGVERPRSDCFLCIGKGILTCQKCLGDCVIWEESIDEQPWEKARSISPLKVKEDDEVDNLEIKLDVRTKAKRVYQPTAPEVCLKISKSLKSLNAKTGIFSNRMKLIHSDPTLHAQRVAAIKKTKGSESSRKRVSDSMKIFFSNPENRRKRSISMKGIKFYCRNCGIEGHRRNYCPEIPKIVSDRKFRCRLCGEKGHNRRTCLKSKMLKRKDEEKKKIHHCIICGQIGHNKRTCAKLANQDSTAVIARGVVSKRAYACNICNVKGHNKRTCPLRK